MGRTNEQMLERFVLPDVLLGTGGCVVFIGVVGFVGALFSILSIENEIILIQRHFREIRKLNRFVCCTATPKS
jgi:hypothetical protein